MEENKINDGGQRISYGEGMAIREPTVGKGRYDLISPFATRRLAEWYELGSQKYAPRNWERGMPYSRYFDSTKRHLDKFLMGMNDEDHLAAAAWNIFAIMHHQELGQTHLDDMPHYLDGNQSNGEWMKEIDSGCLGAPEEYCKQLECGNVCEACICEYNKNKKVTEI